MRRLCAVRPPPVSPSTARRGGLDERRVVATLESPGELVRGSKGCEDLRLTAILHPPTSILNGINSDFRLGGRCDGFTGRAIPPSGAVGRRERVRHSRTLVLPPSGSSLHRGGGVEELQGRTVGRSAVHQPVSNASLYLNVEGPRAGSTLVLLSPSGLHRGEGASNQLSTLLLMVGGLDLFVAGWPCARLPSKLLPPPTKPDGRAATATRPRKGRWSIRTRGTALPATARAFSREGLAGWWVGVGLTSSTLTSFDPILSIVPHFTAILPAIPPFAPSYLVHALHRTSFHPLHHSAFSSPTSISTDLAIGGRDSSGLAMGEP